MTFESVGPARELPELCASIDPKLDDIHKPRSTGLVRLTLNPASRYVHPRARFSRHIAAPGVHKSCGDRTGSQCSRRCSLHGNVLGAGPAGLPSLWGFFVAGVSQVL